MRFVPDTVQCHHATPLGTVHLAANPQGLCGLWFAGQKHAPVHLEGPQAWPEMPEHPLLREAQRQLDAWLAGKLAKFDLPLDLSGGTAFQQTVWNALCAIPWGHTVSYGALSQQLGRPKAVRAVAAAVGRNPISLVVPCHRIVGAQGQLTGYAGGQERKQALLAMEARCAARGAPG